MEVLFGADRSCQSRIGWGHVTWFGSEKSHIKNVTVTGSILYIGVEKYRWDRYVILNPTVALSTRTSDSSDVFNMTSTCTSIILQ